MTTTVGEMKGNVPFWRGRRLRAACAVVLAGALLQGCMTPKSFVDPNGDSAKYEDLVRPSAPVKVKVNVEFQRNGEHFPKVDAKIRDISERVLRGSGMFVPAPDATTGEISIVMNNIADLAAARAKGFGTGLTFGLVGTTVEDDYEMSVTITVDGHTYKKEGLRHAIHTMIGNADAPAGMETMTVSMAVDRAAEKLLLAALKDYQKNGAQSMREPPVRSSLASIWEAALAAAE
jgi:hypothetical protein